jgi:hypothetical protein
VAAIVRACAHTHTLVAGSALLKISATQYRIGAAEREFCNTSAQNTLEPIKRFLDNDMRTIAVGVDSVCINSCVCAEGAQVVDEQTS